MSGVCGVCVFSGEHNARNFGDGFDLDSIQFLKGREIFKKKKVSETHKEIIGRVKSNDSLSSCHQINNIKNVSSY